MARTVKVGLDVDEKPYVRGVERAEKATDKLDSALEDVAGSAKGTAAGMGAASEAIDDTGDSARSAGRALDGMAKDAQRLDRQIDETARGVRDLARAIAATSDEAERAELSKKLTVERSKLREQVDLRKLIDLPAAAKAGAQFGEVSGNAAATSFMRSFRQVSAASGPIAAGVMVAAAQTAAPAISALLAGAVVGAAGVGGVVGGLAIASRHPAVKAAASALGEDFAQTMESAGASFVPVTVSALNKVRAEVRAMEGDFEAVFSAASRYVDPLVDALLRAAQEFMPGFTRAVEEAGPAVDAIGEGLVRVGRASGDLFETMAEHADEGARALQWLFLIIEAGVGFVSDAIAVFSTLYGWMDKLSAVATRDIDRLMAIAAAEQAGSREGKGFSETLQALVGGLDKTGSAASGAAVEVETLSGMLDRLTNENFDARAAQRDLEAAIDDATAAFQENGKVLDDNSPKGRANAAALDKIAQEANNAYEAILTQTGSQEKATAAAERGRAKFIELATKMGMSKDAAIRLAEQLFNIPNVNRSVKVDTGQSVQKIAEVRAYLAGVPNSKTVYVTTILETIDRGNRTGRGVLERRWGGITEHAQTGLLREADVFSPVGPARYAFAEPATGGEAFIPKRGDTARSRAIAEKVVTDWLGGSVQWRGQSTAGSRAPAPAAPAGLTVAQQAAAIRAALIGVRVEMDGRTVGYIQGREASILAR